MCRVIITLIAALTFSQIIYGKLSTYRLTNDIEPESYDLSVRAFVQDDEESFSGRVTIKIVPNANVSVIRLHQRHLNLSDIELRVSFANLVVPLEDNNEYDSQTEILSIFVKDQSLTQGIEYKLSLTFVGFFSNALIGFQKISYITSDNKTGWVGATKLEPTHARQLFPCFDEPAKRANFTIKITHNSKYKAISNMPMDKYVNESDGSITTHFQTSPLMPTYMVAFHIFDFVDRSQSVGEVEHRVFGRPETIDDTKFALDTGSKLIKSFTNYLQSSFPLPKLDQVSVPNMTGNAFVSWGLVKYREDLFLISDKSTFGDRQKITQLLAHEIAHQWFGNLISPEWWSYIWLNEGFANLFEYVAVDWVFPDWKIIDSFVPNVVQEVFHLDIEGHTRPMTSNIEKPLEVGNNFDEITYKRGAAILRMICDALSPEIFRNGIKQYIENRAYSNATEADLFAALEYSVQVNSSLLTSVSDILTTWTNQSGFPIVYVLRNYTAGSIDLIQSKYSPSEQMAQTWWIPINFATATNSDFSQTTPQFWMSNSRYLLRLLPSDLTLLSKDDWIVVNKQATGYYRVMYDEHNYKFITDELVQGNHTKIHPASRSQIIDDAFVFAKNGKINYTVVLEMVKYLHKEEEYAPLTSALNGIYFLHRMLSATEHYHLLRDFLNKTLTPVLRNFGTVDIEGEKYLNKPIRNTIIDVTCLLESEYCLNKTSQMLNNYTFESRPIHQNIRETIYCNGNRIQNTNATDIFLNRLINTLNPQERKWIIAGLGCPNDYQSSMDYLHQTVNNGTIFITEEERFIAFVSVCRKGGNGVKASLDFLVNQLNLVLQSYGKEYTQKAIENLAKHTVTGEQREKFYKICDNSIITEDYCAKAKNNVAVNEIWLSDNQEDIESWLKNELNGSTALTVSYILLIQLLIFLFKFY